MREGDDGNERRARAELDGKDEELIQVCPKK